MSSRRGSAVFWITLCCLAIPGCTEGSRCFSSSTDHCEDNVAWVCNGGGDKGALRWETYDCGTDLVCVEGSCLYEPLVTCAAAQVDTYTCDATGRFVGRCTAIGYWAWDKDNPCDATPDQVCRDGACVPE